MAIVVQTLIFNRIDGLESRVRDNAIAIAKLQEKLSIVDATSASSRAEQVAAVNINAENKTKIGTLELSLKLLEDRYKTISERILTINQRLDQTGRRGGLPPPGEQP